ncbi:hypothetical protein [Kitasatospora sp. NPDC001527]|uniref:phage distal tail protein n=1 Tax=Kitasatospora sp. NPDC001527 TaxID=3154519 RepID=UPI003316E7C6
MELGGVLLGGASAVVLHEPDGILDSPDLRTVRTTRIGRDGMRLGDDRLGGRSITLRMTVLDSPETRARLLAVLRPNADTVLRFAVPGVAGGAARAAVRVGERGTPLDALHIAGAVRIDVELQAADPYLYADQVSTGEVRPDPPRGWGRLFPLRFPFRFVRPTGDSAAADLVVRGTEDVWPVITLPGPLAHPVITNRAGERLVIDLDIPAGESLVVDTGARTVRLNGADRYGSRAPESVWFPLRPGANRWVVNDMSGSNAVVAYVSWRDAWL